MRLVGDHGGEYGSQWEAIRSIAEEPVQLVRLAAAVGQLDAHPQVPREFEAEKAEREARVATTPQPLDLNALRREIDMMVGDLRAVLADGGGRDVLKRLLGAERLRVMPDAERGFVLVEGQRFRLPWTWAA